MRTNLGSVLLTISVLAFAAPVSATGPELPTAGNCWGNVGPYDTICYDVCDDGLNCIRVLCTPSGTCLVGVHGCGAPAPDDEIGRLQWQEAQAACKLVEEVIARSGGSGSPAAKVSTTLP